MKQVIVNIFTVAAILALPIGVLSQTPVQNSDSQSKAELSIDNITEPKTADTDELKVYVMGDILVSGLDQYTETIKGSEDEITEPAEAPQKLIAESKKEERPVIRVQNKKEESEQKTLITGTPVPGSLLSGSITESACVVSQTQQVKRKAALYTYNFGILISLNRPVEIDRADGKINPFKGFENSISIRPPPLFV